MSIKHIFERRMRYPGCWFFALATCALAADQLVKILQRAFVPLGTTVTVIPGVFYLRSILNYGAAFSILRGQQLVFYIVAAVMVIFLGAFWYYERPKTPLPIVGTALIAAGGTGNFIDRLVFGAVYDLINVTFFPFAIFNVADLCMTIGVILFIIWFIFFDGLSSLSSKKLDLRAQDKPNSLEPPR
jgi:signal peptidase II